MRIALLLLVLGLLLIAGVSAVHRNDETLRVISGGESASELRRNQLNDDRIPPPSIDAAVEAGATVHAGRVVHQFLVEGTDTDLLISVMKSLDGSVVRVSQEVLALQTRDGPLEVGYFADDPPLAVSKTYLVVTGGTETTEPLMILRGQSYEVLPDDTLQPLLTFSETERFAGRPVSDVVAEVAAATEPS